MLSKEVFFNSSLVLIYCHLLLANHIQMCYLIDLEKYIKHVSEILKVTFTQESYVELHIFL